MQLFTSRYHNPYLKTAEARSSLVPVVTSLGKPKWNLGYDLPAECREVMPDRWMLHSEKTKEYDGYRRAYRAKLHRTTVVVIREALEKISADHGGRPLVLLCYENLANEAKWCHRRMFAEWWEEQTGEKVDELTEDVPDGADGGSGDPPIVEQFGFAYVADNGWGKPPRYGDVFRRLLDAI